MEQLISAVQQALAAAGIASVTAMPAQNAPRLRGTLCALSTSSVQLEREQYLGTLSDAQSGTHELYGRRANAKLLIEVFSPVSLGAAGCETAAAQVMQVLLTGVNGLRVKDIQRGACSYRPSGDCFVCPLTLQCAAYLYAMPEQDDALFAAFSLKGDIS